MQASASAIVVVTTYQNFTRPGLGAPQGRRGGQRDGTDQGIRDRAVQQGKGDLRSGSVHLESLKWQLCCLPHQIANGNHCQNSAKRVQKQSLHCIWTFGLPIAQAFPAAGNPGVGQMQPLQDAVI